MTNSTVVATMVFLALHQVGDPRVLMNLDFCGSLIVPDSYQLLIYKFPENKRLCSWHLDYWAGQSCT